MITEGTLIAIGSEVQCPDLNYLVVADCFNNLLPDMGEDNAQRVALCWNCHDDLLEACKGVLDFLEYRKADFSHFSETVLRKDALKQAIAKAAKS